MRSADHCAEAAGGAAGYGRCSGAQAGSRVVEEGSIKKITVDKATFDKMHAENRMANDKLKEGIEGFSKALEDLEKMLAKRVSELAKV